MSKDQIKTKKQTVETVETVENLKIVCKMINECISSYNRWNIDKIYPINLTIDTLTKAVFIINNIIF